MLLPYFTHVSRLVCQETPISGQKMRFHRLDACAEDGNLPNSLCQPDWCRSGGACRCSLTIEDADARSPVTVWDDPFGGCPGRSLASEIKVMWITTTIFGCERNDPICGVSCFWGRGVCTEISSAGRCLANWMRVVLCGSLSGLPMTASHKSGQAIKSAWWMPRRREAMKDVVGCDMPRGAVKQALIRGSPNRETGRHWATRWRHLRVNV